MVFKIDFEKSYGKTNMILLFKGLELSGFSATWCGWMKRVVVGVTLCVRTNNNLGRNYDTFKERDTRIQFLPFFSMRPEMFLLECLERQRIII
jgi:hypothetical protein